MEQELYREQLRLHEHLKINILVDHIGGGIQKEGGWCCCEWPNSICHVRSMVEIASLDSFSNEWSNDLDLVDMSRLTVQVV